MPQLPNVNPGDPITSAQWNALVAAVNSLSGPATTGGVTVQNLFGLTLGNAVAILTLPSTQLAVGSIFDSLGNAVNSSQSDSQPLVVLSQSPMPGANVFAGSPINLVVSPKPGSVPPPPALPLITGFTPIPVPIGAELEIDGQNFDPLPSNNQVTFAGVPAAPPSAKSNPAKLFVVVPGGIPGAPAVLGQTLAVDVVVKPPSGATTSKATITAPLANPLPTITAFAPPNPTGGIVGNDITITGTGFDSTAANNTINFDNVVVPAKKATGTIQLVVTIPAGINGLAAPGAFRSVPITVKVGNQISPAVSYNITKF